jgi:hypothetical protein
MKLADGRGREHALRVEGDHRARLRPGGRPGAAPLYEFVKLLVDAGVDEVAIQLARVAYPAT